MPPSNMNVKHFVAGLAVGFGIAIVGAYFLSSRYKVNSSGPSGILMIRTDTWTGKTWMYRQFTDEKNGEKTWVWDPMLEAR